MMITEIKSGFATSKMAQYIPELKKAAQFFIDHFQIKSQVRLQFAYTGKRRWGCCQLVPKTGEIRIKIGYNANTFSGLLETLAHEFVHAKQMDRKELTYTWDGRWIAHWNGAASYNKGTTYKRYREQPWEIEAFENQGNLAALYLESKGETGIVKPEIVEVVVSDKKVWARGEKTKLAKRIFADSYILGLEKDMSVIAADIAKYCEITMAQANQAIKEFTKRAEGQDWAYFRK